MSCISEKMSSIGLSSTIAISMLAREKIQQGVQIISLGIGETDFRAPEHVDEAAIEAINNGETKYPPINGYPELKDAIIKKFKRDNDLEYSPEQVIVCNGVKQALYNLFTTTLNPGDEVIIPSPYWVSYIEMVKIAGGKPVILECSSENNFKLKPEQLKQAITDKTKWFLFNSPNNPTGACYNYNEIKNITDILLEFPHVYLVSDDIYEHIIYGDIEFYTPAQVEPKLYNRTVTVNGASKAYAMTGWRVGYAASGDKEIISAMSVLQSQSTSGVCSIAQKATIAALNGNQEILKLRTNVLKARRDLAAEILSQASQLLKIIVPQGGFYLFTDISAVIGRKTPQGNTISNSSDLCHYLLEHFQVVTIPGEAFGAENFIRISYVTNEYNLKLGCEQVVKACKSLVK